MLSLQELANIQDLQLLAKMVVEGFLLGKHASLKHSAGMEFSQYKNYQNGDDLRMLDWKLLARSEKYYLKQTETETDCAVWFVLDASESMLHEGKYLHKFRYAQYIVASLAYLAHLQGDEIGFLAINDAQIKQLTQGNGKLHWQNFWKQLSDIQPQSKNQNIATEVAFHRYAKNVVVVLTDMYETGEELKNFIKKFKNKRTEVMVFHLVATNEKLLDYPQNTFQDYETKEIIQINNAQKASYQQIFQIFLEENQRFFISQSIDYQVFDIDLTLENILRTYLKNRR